MLVTYEISDVYFRLLGTDDFDVKVKNERFTATGSRCRRNLKFETLTSSLERLRQRLHQKECRACSKVTFLNQRMKSQI